MQKFLLFSSLLLIPITTATIAYAEGANSAHVSQPSLLAQDGAADPFFLTRAKNLARQAAERKNGGLRKYRAETAMYGPAINSPYVENDDGSVTFTFKGGTPGFKKPTVETVATVSPVGSVAIGYNGPIRPAESADTNEQPTSTPTSTDSEESPQNVEEVKQIKELAE